MKYSYTFYKISLVSIFVACMCNSSYASAATYAIGGSSTCNYIDSGDGTENYAANCWVFSGTATTNNVAQVNSSLSVYIERNNTSTAYPVEECSSYPNNGQGTPCSLGTMFNLGRIYLSGPPFTSAQQVPILLSGVTSGANNVPTPSVTGQAYLEVLSYLDSPKLNANFCGNRIDFGGSLEKQGNATCYVSSFYDIIPIAIQNTPTQGGVQLNF